MLGGGGVNGVCRFRGRGGAAAATGHYALRRAGAGAGSLIRGRGRGSRRAGSSGAATRGHARAAARPREGLGGEHITRGGRPSAAPRHTRGPGEGYGRPHAGTNPLTPNPPVARAARTLKAFNPAGYLITRTHTHTHTAPWSVEGPRGGCVAPHLGPKSPNMQEEAHFTPDATVFSCASPTPPPLTCGPEEL